MVFDIIYLFIISLCCIGFQIISIAAGANYILSTVSLVRYKYYLIGDIDVFRVINSHNLWHDFYFWGIQLKDLLCKFSFTYSISILKTSFRKVQQGIVNSENSGTILWRNIEIFPVLLLNTLLLAAYLVRCVTHTVIIIQ